MTKTLLFILALLCIAFARYEIISSSLSPLRVLSVQFVGEHDMPQKMGALLTTDECDNITADNYLFSHKWGDSINFDFAKYSFAETATDYHICVYFPDDKTSRKVDNATYSLKGTLAGQITAGPISDSPPEPVSFTWTPELQAAFPTADTIAFTINNGSTILNEDMSVDRLGDEVLTCNFQDVLKCDTQYLYIALSTYGFTEWIVELKKGEEDVENVTHLFADTDAEFGDRLHALGRGCSSIPPDSEAYNRYVDREYPFYERVLLPISKENATNGSDYTLPFQLKTNYSILAGSFRGENGPFSFYRTVKVEDENMKIVVEKAEEDSEGLTTNCVKENDQTYKCTTIFEADKGDVSPPGLNLRVRKANMPNGTPDEQLYVDYTTDSVKMSDLKFSYTEEITAYNGGSGTRYTLQSFNFGFMKEVVAEFEQRTYGKEIMIAMELPFPPRSTTTFSNFSLADVVRGDAQKVSFNPEEITFKAGEQSATFTITANDDAALPIYVTGLTFDVQAPTAPIYGLANGVVSQLGENGIVMSSGNPKIVSITHNKPLFSVDIELESPLRQNQQASGYLLLGEVDENKCVFKSNSVLQKVDSTTYTIPVSGGAYEASKYTVCMFLESDPDESDSRRTGTVDLSGASSSTPGVRLYQPSGSNRLPGISLRIPSVMYEAGVSPYEGKTIAVKFDKPLTGVDIDGIKRDGNLEYTATLDEDAVENLETGLRVVSSSGYPRISVTIDGRDVTNVFFGYESFWDQVEKLGISSHTQNIVPKDVSASIDNVSPDGAKGIVTTRNLEQLYDFWMDFPTFDPDFLILESEPGEETSVIFACSAGTGIICKIKAPQDSDLGTQGITAVSISSTSLKLVLPAGVIMIPDSAYPDVQLEESSISSLATSDESSLLSTNFTISARIEAGFNSVTVYNFETDITTPEYAVVFEEASALNNPTAETEKEGILTEKTVKILVKAPFELYEGETLEFTIKPTYDLEGTALVLSDEMMEAITMPEEIVMPVGESPQATFDIKYKSSTLDVKIDGFVLQQKGTTALNYRTVDGKIPVVQLDDGLDNTLSFSYERPSEKPLFEKLFEDYGVIAGAAVGGILLIGVIICILCKCSRRTKVAAVEEMA